MKRLFFLLTVAAVMTACGEGGSSTDDTGRDTAGINQGTGTDTAMNNMGDTSTMDTSRSDTGRNTGRY